MEDSCHGSTGNGQRPSNFDDSMHPQQLEKALHPLEEAQKWHEWMPNMSRFLLDRSPLHEPDTERYRRYGCDQCRWRRSKAANEEGIMRLAVPEGSHIATSNVTNNVAIFPLSRKTACSARQAGSAGLQSHTVNLF